MADAFRIAFEQQLMRRKDQALGFAQMNKTCKKEAKLLNCKSLKEDGNFFHAILMSIILEMEFAVLA